MSKQQNNEKMIQPTTEYYNLKIACWLYNNQQVLDKLYNPNDDYRFGYDKKQFTDFLTDLIMRSSDNTNEEIPYEVNYYRSTKSQYKGRQIATGGFQKMLRKIRHTFCQNFYYDLDMVNSAPSILDYIGTERLELYIPHIHRYATARDKVIKALINTYPTYNLTKSDIKQLMIIISFGGSIPEKYEDNEFLKGYQNEINKIIDALLTEDHIMKKFVEIDKEQKKQLSLEAKKKINSRGSLLSQICQFYENKILTKVIDNIKDDYPEIIITTKIFDGFQIYYKDTDGNIIPKEKIAVVLKNINAFLKEEYNNISFISKPFDEALTILPIELTDKLVRKTKKNIANLSNPTTTKKNNNELMSDLSDPTDSSPVFNISENVQASHSEDKPKVKKIVTKKIKKESSQPTENIQPNNPSIPTETTQSNKPTIPTIYKTDFEGALIILQHIGERIIKSGNRYFIKNDKSVPIYIEDTSKDQNEARTFIKRNIPLIKMNRLTPKGKLETKAYNQSTAGINAMAAQVMLHVKEIIDFPNKLWESNLGKIFFKNGFYDFKLRKFMKYEENPHVYSTVLINQDYDPSMRNENDINELYEKILNKMFVNVEHRTYFIEWLARGIAGEYQDKTWMVALGKRNSGKGVINDLLRNTFGKYVVNFNADELLVTQSTNSDLAKKQAWQKPFEFARIAISNELSTMTGSGKGTILDASQIKSISSGGDSRPVRMLFENSTEIKLQARFMMFLNEMCQVSSEDCLQTVSTINFQSEFVDDNELTEEQKRVNSNPETLFKFYIGDPTIKNYIKQQHVINAFMHIIFDHYDINKTRLVVPLSLKENTTDLIESKDNIKEKLHSLFEFTNNDEDRVNVNVVNEILKSNKIFKRMRTELESCGAIQHREALLRYYKRMKVRTTYYI